MTDADKPIFLQAVARLAVSLREKDPDVVLLRVYFDALRDCEIEFVVAAADRLANAKWFPKVGEWRAMASRIEAERREAHRAILRRLPAPLCDACSDTGWIRNSENRVSRCECQELRRLEILGRRTWPELPSGQPTEDAQQ